MTIADTNSLLQAVERLRVDSRSKAWELFLKSGLPSKQQEAFSYVSFDKLYKQTFNQNVQIPLKDQLPQALSSLRFVFVDGELNKELSSLDHLPEDVIYGSIEEAKKDFSSLIKAHEERLYQEQSLSGLDYLNEACYQKGFFLYIPPKCTLLHKVECLHISSHSVSAAKALIFIGKHAEVEFYHHALHPDNHLAVARHEYHLEAGSYCKLIFDDISQKQCFSFHKVIARLKKDSYLSAYQLSQGGLCYRKEYSVDLLEDNSEVDLKGITPLERSDQSHVVVTVRHQAPHCRSHQHFKCLLSESARGSFEGKIWVAKPADKTQAYQLCNHLVLSPKAHAFAKPNLEIFADDVKASHGATIAQLNDEDLFYLKARGLEEQVAKRLLTKGFFREITQHLDENLQKKLEDSFFSDRN